MNSSPALDARIAEPDGRGDIAVVSPVAGQYTLDWTVEHVNHWGVPAMIPVGNFPADVVLDLPAAGCATVAVRSPRVVAYARAAVDSYRRARVTALSGSQVDIQPGACVDRRPGSEVRIVRASAPRQPSVAERRPTGHVAQR